MRTMGVLKLVPVGAYTINANTVPVPFFTE